ncbi:arylsulfatase A-like enzyme [Agromyces sp. 3263]|nr:arylsulfatase A-like enzyme [Agromyces sp. 3263]
MFDSLNRRLLPGYGGADVDAPNFERLAARTAVFDQCYAGSMPCMPARRELHTGRHNFLHRSWGPLEPFDDSVPEMLKQAGIYTHLVTDHAHYWEDGAGTYHNRFNTYEFFRGQEGDLWKGHVADPEPPANLNPEHFLARQDWINRLYLTDEAKHPQTMTFDAGLQFISTNLDEDGWLLHLETFDPHEPFFSYDRYRQQYGLGDEEIVFDWPSYRRVTETDDEIEIARRSYFALVSMCDRSLGRVLDVMDEHDLWRDTMLIVCTDHGFLLGEHGWWGKSVMPWYDESIHTPLYIWDPRTGVHGERRESLVQTVDIGPTLLDYFSIGLTPDMQGHPLGEVVRSDTPVREGALFGAHGGHVNVTDGRYVYMRACADPSNSPLFEYTLMPTHMRSRFAVEELREAEFVPGFDFTKGVPLLKVPAWTLGNPWEYGTLLFDLQTDPDQDHPLRDDELELRMASLLVDLMRANDAPAEQFVRLGLPAEGDVTRKHLQVDRHWEQAERSRSTAARRTQFPDDSVLRTTPLRDLLADDRARAVLDRIVPELGSPFVSDFAGADPVVLAAAAVPGISGDQLAELASELDDGAGLLDA